MKRALISLGIVCLSLTGARAGLPEGDQAFASGDFERAYAELSPLAAENPLAAYYVGLMHLDALGIASNPQTGIYWLRTAAQAGHTGAQLRLALAYEYGEGVTQDFRRAADWMLQAARGGNADAQYYLGQYYHDGKGVISDDIQAYEWIHRSVEYGASHERLLDALLYLGAAREWGRGLRQDLVEAYKWFALASSYSRDEETLHDEATRALDALRIRMNPGQLEQASRQAQAWLDEKSETFATD